MFTITPNLLIPEIGLTTESTISSLKFSRLIQDAILCNRNGLNKMFGDFSIFYEPKNIIGGDFYFYFSKDDIKYIAVCDCTGHGIAGALLTILGHNMLERAFKEYTGLGDVLTFLNKYIIESFSVSSGLRGMGMDLIILGVDKIRGEVEFCGARRPFWVLSKDTKIMKYITKRASIGADIDNTWESKKIKVEKNDRLFMFTDGVTDQFCELSEKKLGARNLSDFIEQNREESLPSFSYKFNEFFCTFKGNETSTDDALLLAIEM